MTTQELLEKIVCMKMIYIGDCEKNKSALVSLGLYNEIAQQTYINQLNSTITLINTITNEDYRYDVICKLIKEAK